MFNSYIYTKNATLLDYVVSKSFCSLTSPYIPCAAKQAQYHKYLSVAPTVFRRIELCVKNMDFLHQAAYQ